MAVLLIKFKWNFQEQEEIIREHRRRDGAKNDEWLFVEFYF